MNIDHLVVIVKLGSVQADAVNFAFAYLVIIRIRPKSLFDRAERRLEFGICHHPEGIQVAEIKTAAFFIPGLPKDLMAYLAAFAGMRPVHLAVVTTAGRLPSVLAITLGSSFAAAGDWRATAIVFSVTAAAVVIGALAYHRFKRQRDGGAGGAAK